MNDIMVFTIGPTTFFLNLDDEEEKKEALEKFYTFINGDWTVAIYIKTKHEFIDLYYSMEGIMYENLHRLYDYYDKETIAPIIMELKLKNRR